MNEDDRFGCGLKLKHTGLGAFSVMKTQGLQIHMVIYVTLRNTHLALIP
jgi:hypothetical protein